MLSRASVQRRIQVTLQIRPQGDAWLVSASTALLDGYVSPALTAALGWDASPSANVLAAQLKQLGEMHHPEVTAAEFCPGAIIMRQLSDTSLTRDGNQ